MTERLDDRLHKALQARARQALGHWPVPPQEPHLLKYRENAVFRMILPDGRFAALRLHRPGYHGLAALQSELDWMAALHDDGLDVPHALASRNGSFVVTLPANADFDTQHTDIVSWMEGAQLGETGKPLAYAQTTRDALFHQIGASMAAMHASADRFQPPADFYRPSWNDEGLVGEKPLWGRFWDCPMLTQDERLTLSALRDRLRKALTAFTATRPDYGLIHADLIRENVLVRDNAVAFIDFDDAGYGFRLFDIATALLKNRKEPNYPDLQQALIDGYRSRRSLSDDTLSALPLFLTLRSLTYIGWLAARPEVPDARARLSRYIADSLRMAKAGGYLD